MPSFRFFYYAGLFLVVVSLSSCGNKPKSPGPESKDKDLSNVLIGAPITPSDAGPPSVIFNLKLVETRQGLPTARIYECSYAARGSTARFRLELVYGTLQKDSDGLSTAPADGKFIAMNGSENSTLIEDLKNALEAKKMPTNVKRVKELPFDAVILGQNMSRNPSGGLAQNPPGNWTGSKIFLPKGGDDGQVFLNISQSEGKGEFSLKDSDYGDYVLAQLAGVL